MSLTARLHAKLRTAGRWVAAVACLLVAFILGFTLFFPAETLRPRLEQEALKRGVALTIGPLSTTFPPALVARNVIVRNATGDPLLTIERVRIRPCWLKLLIGSVAVNFQGELLGGTVEGEVARNGAFELSASQLAWRGPLPGLGETLLSGRLQSATADGVYPPRADSLLHLDLALAEVQLEKLPIPGAEQTLSLGTITLHASGQGKNLRLETLNANGGQLTAAGEGTLVLADPVVRSPLTLTLRLRPTPELNPSLAELLTALLPPTSDGTSPLRLGGTLAAPRRL